MENTQKPIKATLDSSDDSVKTQKPILIQLEDIPQPTDADAGKVLGVDEEGKYALTEGGGGGGEIFYPVYIIDDGEGNYTSDKTITEILTAMDENKIPVAIYEAREHWFNGNMGVNRVNFMNIMTSVIPNALSYSMVEIAITNGNEVTITYTDAEVAATIT